MYTKKYSFPMVDEEISIENFIKRYHFDENDTDFIRATGTFLTNLLCVHAAIRYEEDKVVCVVTLGKTYDDLEDVVMECGNLLVSYCMECFGMEFLSKAYEKLEDVVFAQTGKYLGEYCFLEPGDAKLYEELLALMNVSTLNGMLHPLKSVVFTAEYKMDKSESGCHSCENCKNQDCAFREVVQCGKEKFVQGLAAQRKNRYGSYGIARILEKGGAEKEKEWTR